MIVQILVSFPDSVANYYQKLEVRNHKKGKRLAFKFWA